MQSHQQWDARRGPNGLPRIAATVARKLRGRFSLGAFVFAVGFLGDAELLIGSLPPLP